MLKYFTYKDNFPDIDAMHKYMHDTSKIVENYFKENKIKYKEYNIASALARYKIIHLLLPYPKAKYIFYSFPHLPIFVGKRVLFSIVFMYLIALKKKIFKEKYYLILEDLMEWQSYSWASWAKRPKLRLSCLLERFIVSRIADEVISPLDPTFLKKEYRLKKVHETEFIDYFVDHLKTVSNKPDNLRILYSGDLRRKEIFNNLKTVLETLNPSSKLIVTGYGLNEDEKKYLEKTDNFEYLGQLNTEDLNKVAQDCQFGLLVSPKLLYSNINAPSKLSFYIVNGLTVICSNFQKIKRLNDKYNFGYVLDDKEFFNFIRTLSPEKNKRNTDLEMQIKQGSFLSRVLERLDLK